MRKILLAGTTLGLLASSALAGDLSVTVTGRNFTEAGGVFGVTDAYKNVSVGSTFNPLNVTPSQKTYGIGNAARIGVRTQIEADNGMKYGAVASLATTASRDNHPRDNRTYIFAEGNFGRLEAGSNVSVSRSMALGASTIAAASGGASDGNWSNYVRLGSDVNAATALTANNLDVAGAEVSSTRSTNGVTYLMMSEKTFINGLGNVEETRKVSYYSPKVNGLQLGLSFAPDGANTGNSPTVSANGLAFDALGNNLYKNILSGGVSYSMERDNMTFDIAAVGDMGTNIYSANPHTANEVRTANYNLRSYNVGTVLGFGKVKFAAGYGSNGKSGRISNVVAKDAAAGTVGDKSTGSKSRQFNLGVAYENGPMTSSLTYFDSLASDKTLSSAANTTPNSYVKVQALSLGAHYKVASGVVPYIEATYVKINPGAKSTYVSTTTPATGTKGTRGHYKATVVLAGTAINF